MSDIANNSYFALILFFLATVGVLLQFIGAINFSKDDSFCDFSMHPEVVNMTEFKGERLAVATFRNVAWVAFITEFIAFVLVASRIKCCVQHCCVPTCGKCWMNVYRCGNSWFVFGLISAGFNLIGLIVFRIFSTSCVFSILAYRYVLANFIIGTLKGLSYIAFLCKFGCPDTSKFLGSEKEVADYDIETTRTTTTYDDGRVVKRDSHELARRY